MGLRERLQVLHTTGLFDHVDEALLAVLADAATLVDVDAGDVVFRQGEPSTSMFVVEDGVFEVLLDGEGERKAVGEARAGDLLGEVQLITGGERTATVQARVRGRLLELDKSAFDALTTEHPEVLAAAIEIINARLLGLQLARALAVAFGPAGADLARDLARDPAWVRVDRGEVLLEAGEFGDDAYLVVSGELLILSDRTDKTIFGTIGTGELVGEFALLKPGARTATVIAARESWLVRVSHARFKAASDAAPALSTDLAEVLLHRLRTRGTPRPRRQTIALLPLSPSAPIERLVRDLQAALTRFGECSSLSAADAARTGLLRRPRELAPESPAWTRLTLWLQTERSARSHILLVGDSDDTGWNRRLLAEADHVVLVADARRDGALTSIDEAVARVPHLEAWESRIWLLFAHPADTRAPSGSAAWLGRRDVDVHLHVRVGRDDDVARAARMLAGRAVGVALSGGAARGFAHVGIYQAWIEAGLPIDCVAGTSAGAFLGGLMAMETPPDELLRRIDETFAAVANPFGDVTLPTISLIRGRRIRDLLRGIYGEVDIEDLWLPFSATCTNLSRGTCERRRRGLLWRALLASGSPPAVAPPVILDGDLYCDGGVIDNLPVGALDPVVYGVRIASHVGGSAAISIGDLEELPSPWSLAWDRVVRKGRRTAGIPNVGEIVVRAMTLGDARRIDEARGDLDLFFEPPVSSFPMFDFSRAAAVIRSAHAYASRLLADDPRAAALQTLLR
ncbi:MAG: cyclic nucleotide-binding domain-containing protein [Nannocystaceae bacterium]